MKRHYYVHEDLQEIYKVEKQLENAGFSEYQIHVLSEDDAAVDAYKLHSVGSLFRQDIIRSGLIGFAAGVLAATAVVLIALALNVADAMWVPIIFLAIVLLGFCTWEGGLWGIQEKNKEFERFEEHLKNGKHVVMVDVKSDQEAALHKVIANSQGMQDEGEGASSEWMVGAQTSWNKFVRWAP